MTIPNDFPWRAGMRVLPTDDYPALRVAYVGPHDTFGPDIIGQAYAEDPDDVDAYVFDGTDEPDLTDPATVGALEGAVAEAHGEPTLHARPVHMDAYDSAEPTVVWHIERAKEDDHEWLRESGAWGAVENGHRDRPIVGQSKADALLAAWNNRPVTR